MEYLNLNIYNQGQLSGPTCKSQQLNMTLILNKKYIYRLLHRASNLSKSQEYNIIIYQDFVIKLVGPKTECIYHLLQLKNWEHKHIIYQGFIIKFDRKLKIITHRTKDYCTGSTAPGRKMKLNKLNHCLSSPGLGSKRDDQLLVYNE